MKTNKIKMKIISIYKTTHNSFFYIFNLFNSKLESFSFKLWIGNNYSGGGVVEVVMEAMEEKIYALF